MLATTPTARDLTRTAGVVYTPEWLARFVLDRVLDGASVGENARWLDPACGDGVFLVEVVRRLASGVVARDLPGVVERCVFGVDIDDAACNLARAAVVAAVEDVSGPQPVEFFAANVRCTDFLALDPSAADRADLVVGNPPYVSATNLNAADKERFLGRFESAWGRLDLYGLFIEQGLRFLNPGGSLGYITPDKWLTAGSSVRLRALVSREHTVRTIDRFDRHDLFPGVATVPCVVAIDEHSGDTDHADCRWWETAASGPVARRPADKVTITVDGAPWAPSRISGPITGATRPLTELVERISVGLATGLDRCFIVNQPQAAGIEPELLRPVARGRDVQVGGLTDAGLWLLLPYRFGSDGGSAQLVALADYPGAYAHLEQFRADLERRHCVRVWGKPWYALHDPVKYDLASRPKILLPDLAHEPRFALDHGQVLPLHSVYYLLLRQDAALDGEELTALLNSPAIRADLRRRAPTAKSGYRRFRTAVLRDVRVPYDAS